MREHGKPLVDDPDRVGVVAQLGVDETSWSAATKNHATIYAIGLVDRAGRSIERPADVTDQLAAATAH